LKSIEDATAIRSRLISVFESAEREMVQSGRHSALNFVIIGGGPTGIELAGAIADITKNFMRGAFRRIDPAKARVMILEGSPRILAAYPEDLSQKAVAQLQHFGVEVHTSARVTDIQSGYVMLGDKKIESAVTLWGAGVQASPLGKLLKTELDQRGCVVVNEHLNPVGRDEVFVCGDLAHVVEAGRQIPGVAQPAMQMGDHVARMIGQDLADRPRTAFHYFDKGDMSTIGRFAAVAKVVWPFKAHWGGFIAWLSWLTVHIFFLVGFRNRLSVICEWAYTMVTSTCGACLITGEGLQTMNEERTPLQHSTQPAATLRSHATLPVVACFTATMALTLLIGFSKPDAPPAPPPLPTPVMTATQQDVPLRRDECRRAARGECAHRTG
jgi:NADH dehydrogenase